MSLRLGAKAYPLRPMVTLKGRWVMEVSYSRGGG